MGKKWPSVNEYIENQNQAGFQGRVLWAALPLAAVPAWAAVLAGVWSYFWAKSIQNSAENLSQAHQLSRQESAARKSWDTQYANTLEQQKNNYLREWVLSAGDTAAILGVGGMANGALKKVKWTQKLETWTSSTPKGSSASPEPSTTPRTNRDALGLWPKTRENTRRNSDRWADLPAAWTGFKKVESVPGKYLDLWGTQGSWKNVRRNPDKPVEWATLPEPRQIFKKVASKDASGNTTSMTREFHSEYDRANNKYLGRTQIDKSITRDAQWKKVKWDSTTYWPRDYTNSPTQIRQDRRKFDANGNMIQGENRTLLSDWSQRIFKMTPDGFQSTHISANWDVKQRHRNRVNPAATPAATPQLPDHLQKVTTPPAKVEAPKSKPVPTNEEIEATRLLKKKSSTPSRTL